LAALRPETQLPIIPILDGSFVKKCGFGNSFGKDTVHNCGLLGGVERGKRDKGKMLKKRHQGK